MWSSSRIRVARAACVTLLLALAAGVWAADNADLLRQGRSLYDKGRLGDALVVFEQAGDDPEALYFRFRILLEDMGDTAEAKLVGERLRRSFPSTVYASRINVLLDALTPPPAPKPAPVKAPAADKEKPAAAAADKPAPKARPAQPKPKKPAEDEPSVRINVTDVELKDFLKSVSEMTGEYIIYDQRVGGKITVLGPDQIPLSSLFDLTRAILTMHGYTLVRDPVGWRVTPLANAMRGSLPLETGPGEGGATEMVTRIFQMDEISSTNQVRGVISSMLSPNNNFQVLPKSNLLVITDTREVIDKVAELLEQIRVIQEGFGLRQYELKYVKAQDAKSRLDSLLSSFMEKTDYTIIAVVENNTLLAAATERDLAHIDDLLKEVDTDFSFDVQLKIIPLQHAAEDIVAKYINDLLQVGTGRYAAENLKVVPDPRRRALIISSVSPHVLALVTKLVGEIDQPSVPRQENIHIYKLLNANALKISDKLTTLYKDRTGADRIGIAADEESNSLIITASSQIYSELVEVIHKLDLNKSQVWVELFVVDVSADKARDIGIQWALDEARLIRGTTYTAAAGVVTGVSRANDGFNIGVTKSGSDISAVFAASLNEEDFEILSTPHLLMRDGEEAKISVGDVVPILQNSQVTDVGTVIKTFNFENVGTDLTITPHVNGDKVTLDIGMVVQEVKSVEELGAPTRSSRNLQTTITVGDAQTVVLGGVLGTRESLGHTGVPGLSKLPLLGNLFKRETKKKTRTNLLIFITPTLVKTQATLDQLTDDRKKRSPNLKEEGYFVPRDVK